jgi:hypothetical protein
MIFPELSFWVGEQIPVRYSFLSLLKDFLGTSQSLVGASITWTSQTPALATFAVGSAALVTSDQGSADGIANDACLGRFTMVAAGLCTVQVGVDDINPLTHKPRVC